MFLRPEGSARDSVCVEDHCTHIFGIACLPLRSPKMRSRYSISRCAIQRMASGTSSWSFRYRLVFTRSFTQRRSSVVRFTCSACINLGWRMTILAMFGNLGPTIAVSNGRNGHEAKRELTAPTPQVLGRITVPGLAVWRRRFPIQSFLQFAAQDVASIGREEKCSKDSLAPRWCLWCLCPGGVLSGRRPPGALARG